MYAELETVASDFPESLFTFREDSVLEVEQPETTEALTEAEDAMLTCENALAKPSGPCVFSQHSSMNFGTQTSPSPCRQASLLNTLSLASCAVQTEARQQSHQIVQCKRAVKNGATQTKASGRNKVTHKLIQTDKPCPSNDIDVQTVKSEMCLPQSSFFRQPVCIGLLEQNKFFLLDSEQEQCGIICAEEISSDAAQTSLADLHASAPGTDAGSAPLEDSAADVPVPDLETCSDVLGNNSADLKKPPLNTIAQCPKAKDATPTVIAQVVTNSAQQVVSFSKGTVAASSPAEDLAVPPTPSEDFVLCTRAKKRVKGRAANRPPSRHCSAQLPSEHTQTPHSLPDSAREVSATQTYVDNPAPNSINFPSFFFC